MSETYSIFLLVNIIIYTYTELVCYSQLIRLEQLN